MSSVIDMSFLSLSKFSDLTLKIKSSYRVALSVVLKSGITRFHTDMFKGKVHRKI